MPKQKGLNLKQRRFVSEYLLDLNATQAAIRAGYSKKSAAQQAWDLLRNPKVQQAVQKSYNESLDHVDKEVRELLVEMARLAKSDIRECFDEHGQLRPIKDLPDPIAAAISSVEVVETFDPESGSVERVHKYKLWDKNTAQTNLAKHFGLFKTIIEGKIDVEHTVIPLDALSPELKQRIVDELEAADPKLIEAAVVE